MGLTNLGSAIGNIKKGLVISRTLTISCTVRGNKVPEEAFPKNPLAEYYSASKQRLNGYIYDKKPARFFLHAGKKYGWCLCGRSNSQPFCDGVHKINALRIVQKPILFTVDESKEYWLCNCKQTKHRPFCDGTHNSPHIQALKK